MSLLPPNPWRAMVAKLTVHGVLSFWALMCLFPLYWVTVTSLKGVADIDGPPSYLPFVDFKPSLESWRFILADPHENLARRFVNSTAIGIVSTLVTIVIAGMADYSLTRFRAGLRWPSLAFACLGAGLFTVAALVSALPLKALFFACAILLLALAVWCRRRGPTMNTANIMAFMLATRILPPVIVVLPLYMMARATGLLDTLTALVLTYTAINLPVTAWLLQPILGLLATDQEEAAQLDGASHFTIFFTILLPMARGGVFAASLLIFLLCWNEYLFAAYLTADHALTLPPWMVGQLSLKEAQIGGEAEEWAHLSAATLVMVFPALIFAAIAQRALGRITAFGE